MRIEVPIRYSNDLSDTHIKRILEYFGLGMDFERYCVNRNGRFIRILDASRTIYVIFSRLDAREARNAFLNQYIVTSLSKYFEDGFNNTQNIYVYLLDTSPRARAAYMVDTYKMLKTIGIEIINISDVIAIPIKPYSSVYEWKLNRERRQEYNPSNRSTYVLEDESVYRIYGKSFGANGKEASLICCFIGRIAHLEGKRAYLYQVKDNGADELSQTDRDLIAKFGVQIQEAIIPRFRRDQYLRMQRTGDVSSRDQGTFIYNLLEKYGRKRCLICGFDLEEGIIASHIHRITDIDNSNIAWEEKCRQAVDPDNGMWLCANHDKMFENGLFYFNSGQIELSNQLRLTHNELSSSTELILSLISDEDIKMRIAKFVRSCNDLLVLDDYSIPDKLYNDQMGAYLDKHRKRVTVF